MKNKVILGLMCSLFVLVLIGCSGEETAVAPDTLLAQIPTLYSDNTQQADGTFVGTVTDSDFFVGVVVQGETAVAYLCNGQDVGEWLRGSVANGQLALRSNSGATLAGLLADGVLSGEVMVAERPYAFTATPAQNGTTGLYRHTADNITAGWIILENGIVGTSSDGSGVALLDRPRGKEEAGGNSTNAGSNPQDPKQEEDPRDFITPGAAGDGEQATTLGEASLPSCETTREGCGGPTVNCDALRSDLSAAERALGDLERELSQNGVQNLRDHPAMAAAQRPIFSLNGELRSGGCG
jgi:hypothetical protein